jgi:hypothetical protein
MIDPTLPGQSFSVAVRRYPWITHGIAHRAHAHVDGVNVGHLDLPSPAKADLCVEELADQRECVGVPLQRAFRRPIQSRAADATAASLHTALTQRLIFYNVCPMSIVQRYRSSSVK